MSVPEKCGCNVLSKIRNMYVYAPDPAKVLLSPEASVWDLPASMAESATFRHVRGYRGLVRFPPWNRLETVGGPCAVPWSMPRVGVWQIPM
jgi:hypothetical protein